VSPFNGKTTRRRPVPEVIAELKHAKEWLRSDIVERMTHGSLLHALSTSLKIWVGLEEGSIVAFVDDLHNSHRAYCRELWQALKSLNIKWGCQSTLFLGDDPELVKLAADSGCVSVFVGMESLSEDSLGETNKGFNQVRKFEDQIKMFHDHGIMVNPGIVFGFDNDDESVFETTINFLTRNKVELAYFNVLTPLPGTALFERYNREGRIIDRDWAKYDGKYVVYKPKRMTPEQLQEGFFWANHEFYSWPCIWKRVAHTSQRLIPRLEMNCPNALFPQASQPAKKQELCLNVKARRHDAFAALFIELEGTLDHLNARELLARIKQAAQDAKMDIVVNFEHLKHATPKAIQTLLDGETLKAITPHANLRYRKLKEAFQATVAEMAPGDWDIFEENTSHA
jgi:hypothetical protein